MFKIVYASGKSSNSRVQLERFLHAVKNEPYEIKLAGYKGFYPRGYSVDWTLDKIWVHKLKNTLYDAYLDQMGRFNPDLVISDLDYPTTSIASYLKKQVWQYSSSLLFYSMPVENKLMKKLNSVYDCVIKQPALMGAATKFCYQNSDINFVCSHLADTHYSKEHINRDFYFLRPYHIIGKQQEKQYNLSSAYSKNRRLIDLVRRYKNSIVLSDSYKEDYPTVEIENINNQDVYSSSIRNSKLFVCDGNAQHIADAFYNNKKMIFYPDMFERYSVINSIINEKAGFGTCVYNPTTDISKYIEQGNSQFKYDGSVQFLHEKINSYFKIKGKKNEQR